MKDPSPEDMSYLTDQNVEWCCEHYFAELVKRDLRRAAAFRHRLLDYFGEERQKAERLPMASRNSA